MNNVFFFTAFALLVVVILIYLGRKKFFHPFISKKMQSLGWTKYMPPSTYTTDNVTVKGIHPIFVAGKVQQKFYVEKIVGEYFFVRVFTYGGDVTQGMPPVTFFMGWTKELLNNSFITYNSLLQELPKKKS